MGVCGHHLSFGISAKRLAVEDDRTSLEISGSSPPGQCIISSSSKLQSLQVRGMTAESVGLIIMTDGWRGCWGQRANDNDERGGRGRQRGRRRGNPRQSSVKHFGFHALQLDTPQQHWHPSLNSHHSSAHSAENRLFYLLYAASALR